MTRDPIAESPSLPPGWNPSRSGPDEPLRMALFASGGGTNVQAILDACKEGRIFGRVVAVVSNRPDAYALERARRAGVAAIAVDHRSFSSRAEHERAMLEAICDLRPHVAILAGYMRMVTPYFLRAFRDPVTGMPGVINIHPADTRAYQGTKGYEFALGLLEKHPVRLERTFVTVHFVDEGMDTGPIIRKMPVPVLPDDTLETLKARGLAVEHRLYPEVLDALARGRVRMEDGRVVLVGDERSGQ